MKFLLVVSLAAVAIILASRKSKEADDFSGTIEDDYEGEELSYSDEIVPFSDPSSLRSSYNPENESLNTERPEYLSDDVPVMEIDAETEKRESLISNTSQRY